jgi:hypothetical protein
MRTVEKKLNNCYQGHTDRQNVVGISTVFIGEDEQDEWDPGTPISTPTGCVQHLDMPHQHDDLMF